MLNAAGDKSFVDDLVASGYCKCESSLCCYEALRFIPCFYDLFFFVFQNNLPNPQGNYPRTYRCVLYHYTGFQRGAKRHRRYILRRYIFARSRFSRIWELGKIWQIVSNLSLEWQIRAWGLGFKFRISSEESASLPSSLFFLTECSRVGLLKPSTPIRYRSHFGSR